jgi:hypothetical protein
MIRSFYISLTCLVLMLVHGCGEEDYPVPPASTVPKFTVALDNNEFAPAQATFTNVSVIPDRAGSYVSFWSFGDGASSKELAPVHLYKQPGVYTVNLVIITSASNEINEFSMKVIVKDPNASGTPVYYTNGSALFTALINDQAPLGTPTGVSGLDDVYGVVADTVHDKLYIPDYGAGKIIVANLDGSGAADFRTNIGDPTSVAIDYANNQLYWDTGDGIRRTDLDNDQLGAYEDFVTGQGDDPEGMSIDPVNNRLYWNTYNGGIWRKNLDGTGEAEIVPGEGGGSILVVGDRIYYDTYIKVDDISQLVSADLSGNSPALITSGMSNVVYGIAYDGGEDKLYWADRGADRIMRANADGTDPEPWYTGVVAKGFAIGKEK